MLKIGNISLSLPFIQASLSGYSDAAMRRLALDFGAPLTFVGVMLAKSAASPKMLRNPLFRPKDDEHPVGAQLLGREPATMAKAAKALEDAGYDIIDLNFACPAPKVLRRQRGGYLLNEPEKAIEIYDRVREAITCPVTIKLRTGYKNDLESYDNMLQIVSESAKRSVDALAIHGRRVVQRFTGKVNFEILAEIKRNFPKITIIGSGDNFEATTIIGRLKSTGLDGALIARGAVGNPWIYRELNALWLGKPLPTAPDLAEQADVILRHFYLICDIFGRDKAIRYFRKFLTHYCKLHPKRKKAQKDLLAATNKNQLISMISKWYLNQQKQFQTSIG